MQPLYNVDSIASERVFRSIQSLINKPLLKQKGESRRLHHMLLMVDNYDSFTFNIVRYFRELNVDVQTRPNDAISIEDIRANPPSHIVISPGPGTPQNAGVSMSVIQSFAGKIPILGVCLGHQCIAEVFGGKVGRAKNVLHGKTSEVFHHDQGVFRGVPSPFLATRYHSLLVEAEALPETLEITAWSGKCEWDIHSCEIMGLRHTSLPVEGVQFHPEAILSECGHDIFKNFLERY